jgi:MFS superfamily sulfate permease-like transporter
MAYDLTNSRARDPLIVMVVFTFIAILTTFMRLKARHLRSLPLGLDDYLMLVALVRTVHLRRRPLSTVADCV